MPRPSLKRHHNLPAHRLRLIGRERELQVVRHALLGAEGRLLTLTGTGGCGKTRLALELAADVLPHFSNGVWLVELASVADPALVASAIVSALGIRERPGEPLTATLVGALSKRELLLVIDNCEHVVEVCARVVEELLDKCPRLRVLATSRETLRIPGEMTWHVPSLALPDKSAGIDDLLRSPAVQLFIERAQAAVPNFTVDARAAVVGHICSRLDGLPLALELAAARVRTLGVEQILERLDECIRLLVGGSRTAPTRHQTLRATLDWSYGLLSVDERAVFRRLAVVAESCSLDAAEAICLDDDVARTEVLDLLQRLVDKSMLVMDERNGQARYRLLEPVRQYAHERLIANGERDAARRRHAQYYAAFGEARDLETNRGGSRRFDAVRELGVDYPNIRTALAWSIESGETQLGLRLAGSLNFHWQISGSVIEGLGWLRQLLALPGADEPTVGRARAILAAARLAQVGGAFKDSRAFCEEALLLARRVADPLLELLALMFSATNALAIGDAGTAEHVARDALECARAAADPIGEGQVLMQCAQIACDHADYTAAQPFATEALRLARVGNDAWNEGWALAALGSVALGRGALHDARAALYAGLSVARQQAEPSALTSVILDALGELETASGQTHEAQAWLASSLDVRYEGGERTRIGETLDRLAAVAAACAKPERALQLAGAVDALYQEHGAKRSTAEQQKLERWLLPLRAALGEQAVGDLILQGRALALDAAIALARSDGAAAQASTVALTTPVLTAREQQVAALLRRGLSNRQIAEQLVITERTVASHIEHILEKLGFASRHQVGAWMVEHGLLG